MNCNFSDVNTSWYAPLDQYERIVRSLDPTRPIHAANPIPYAQRHGPYNFYTHRDENGVKCNNYDTYNWGAGAEGSSSDQQCGFVEGTGQIVSSPQGIQWPISIFCCLVAWLPGCLTAAVLPLWVAGDGACLVRHCLCLVFPLPSWLRPCLLLRTPRPYEWDEVGACGMCSLEQLTEIIPVDELWPIEGKITGASPSAAWHWHAAFGVQHNDSWLSPSSYRWLFSPSRGMNGTWPAPLPDLQAEMEASQFLQAEGYRYIYQSNRRARWHRSAVAIWTFNEPFPNAAHGCLVDVNHAVASLALRTADRLDASDCRSITD